MPLRAHASRSKCVFADMFTREDSACIPLFAPFSAQERRDERLISVA